MIPVRDSDRRIQCEEEFSDSEDEGEGGRRDVYSNREGGRSRKRARPTPVEKMVSNGTETSNNEETKPAPAATAPAPVAAAANGPPTADNPTKSLGSSSSSPKEASPKTEASNTAEVSTEPTQTQEASRKR